MEHSYAIVDVFTDTPLEGNPVAVFTDADGLSGQVMRRAARELNLSETVFVLPGGQDADARVRIFTPCAELPFAGHPVLGTAVLLGEASGAAMVRLSTGLGVIPIALRTESTGVAYGEMEQKIPTPEPFPAEAELLAALGVARSELPVEAYRNGPLHVYVALGSQDEVAGLRPDLTALAHLTERLRDEGHELGCNCFAGRAGHFKTRMFAPGVGVAEDPATGSAAGPLALHLVRHGWAGYGERLEIRQGAEIGRPSLIHARVEGRQGRAERVLVGGSAVIVARGGYRLV